MKITEKDINELYKAMKCCKDGRSCAKCPFRTDFDCIAKLEHKVTELYISEHPEIFNEKEVKE